MTENKRFTVDGLTITENSPKGRKYLLEYHGGVNALCSRINGLFDKSKRLEKENKKLKEEIKGFEGCSHNWGLLYDEAKNKVEELSKENKDLEEARSYYQENFLTMKTERNQLKEENEQLKEENKEYKSFLYKKLECSKRRTNDRF